MFVIDGAKKELLAAAATTVIYAVPGAELVPQVIGTYTRSLVNKTYLTVTLLTSFFGWVALTASKSFAMLSLAIVPVKITS